jgi:hypothetical protein
VLLFVPATAAQASAIHVRSTIQQAVDAAQPGDVVLVPAGSYHENVVVSTDGISIVALPGAVLDGTGVLGSVGIRVAPSSPTGTLRHAPEVEPGLPARLVLRAPDGRQVEFHPLVFDPAGNGWQELPDGGWGLYPADGLRGRGEITGRPVRCTTPELQLRHHLGYRLTDTDRQDLRLLATRFGLPLPPKLGDGWRASPIAKGLTGKSTKPPEFSFHGRAAAVETLPFVGAVRDGQQRDCASLPQRDNRDAAALGCLGHDAVVVVALVHRAGSRDGCRERGACRAATRRDRKSS